MMADRLKVPFQEPRANSDSVDACPFCLRSLADMNASEYGDHLKRCLMQPAKPTVGHNGLKKGIQTDRTHCPSISDSHPSTSASVPELHTCPCCEKVALPASELDVHLRSCGIESVSSSTPSISLSATSSSIPSLFSDAEIASVTTTKEQRPARQTRITLKKLQKIDEETQVALALSASLMPQELPSRRPKKNLARGKIKFVQPPPVLLEQDPSESRKTLSDKVTSVIGVESVDKSFGRASVLPESKLVDAESLGDGIYSQNLKLWNLSREMENEEVARFYVSSLVPPISPKKMDDEVRLKHLSQIPGFRLHLDASHQSVFKPTFSQPASVTIQETTSCSDTEILEEASVHAMTNQDSAPMHDTPVTLTEEPTPNENNDEDDNHTLILCSSDDDVGRLEDVEDCVTVGDFKATVPASNSGEGRFAALSDDQLSRKLEKFGVKPLGRAQAIAFLNAVTSQNTKKRAKPKFKKPRKRKKSEIDLNGMASFTVNVGNQISAAENEIPGVSSNDAKKGHKKRPNMRIVQLVSSDDDDTESVPCSSSSPELPSKRAVKPVKLVTSEEVSTVLTRYIREHVDLCEQVLQYQIVYLRPFLKKLKADGYQVNPQLAMDYFDHQSIAFSQHNEDKPRAWGGRKVSKK